MANLTLHGFRYAFSAVCGEPQKFKRELANNYATAIGIGDVIIQVSDGTVGIAGATDEPFGVVVGCWYTRAGESLPRPAITIPANTTFTPTTVGSRQASVVEFIPAIPSVHFFEADADTTTTDIATAIGYIGENTQTEVTTAADAVLGSREMLDISDHATTESLPWRLVDIVRYPGVAYDAARVKYIVTANHSGWPSAATNRVGI